MTGQGRQAVPPELAFPLSGGQQAAADHEVARFYSEHRERLLRFLVFVCRCPEADAEDIIQDTIMVIRKYHWATIRSYDKPVAFWFRAVVWRYRELLRRQAGRIADGDPTELLLGVAHPGDQFAAVDRREALNALIRELPPRQRQVLWLRLIADFSEAETAEILGISIGSVKTHLHHARERMQELLHKDGATWEEEVR